MLVYGRKTFVYLGDGVRRIVGKGGCFPLWTPLDSRYRLYTLRRARGRHEARAVKAPRDRFNYLVK